MSNIGNRWGFSSYLPLLGNALSPTFPLLGDDSSPTFPLLEDAPSPTFPLLGDAPSPTLPLPGEGVRGWCILVPPPSKGEVRWGSILHSRNLAMFETHTNADGQTLGVKA